jgi:hypothetical protein
MQHVLTNVSWQPTWLHSITTQMTTNHFNCHGNSKSHIIHKFLCVLKCSLLFAVCNMTLHAKMMYACKHARTRAHTHTCMHAHGCTCVHTHTHSLNNSYLHAIWRESWHSNHTTVTSLECRVWEVQDGTDQSSSLSLNETCSVSQILQDKTKTSKVYNKDGSGVYN